MIRSLLRHAPATVFLLVANLVVFIACVYQLPNQGPEWTVGLLRWGAEYGPLSLGTEVYRVFTHLFLHGNVMHLLFNLYALFSVGQEVETIAGTRKFIWVYLLAGITASIASLYFNLFVVGVGASGAIFGLFGFALIVQLAESRKDGRSMAPILINFGIFITINLLFATALNADNAAHLGGLAGGMILGALSLIDSNYRSLRPAYLLSPLVVVVFLLLPRYQVTYYRFFQKILKTEDDTNALFGRNLSDEEFVSQLRTITQRWDTARQMLDAHTFLPAELHEDTAKLRNYIHLRQREAIFRAEMVEKQIYRYLDSIEWAQEKIAPNLRLDYPLTLLHQRPASPRDTINTAEPPQPVTIWYNEEWEEIPYPPAAYSRIGVRDSLGRWQGPLRDYYRNGKVQMKGSYIDSKKDGIFLYYSDHNTYTSAGRYVDDRAVGRWETFYNNGQLKTEEFYGEDYYVKTIWDSLGNVMVRDGHGTFQQYHDNGQLAEQGNYEEGKKQGVWQGWHRNGAVYFEEYFMDGRLVRGRSRTLDGVLHDYDATSLFARPEGGNQQLVRYLKEKATALQPDVHGTVRLSFRVTTNRVITDVVVEKSLRPDLDALAIEWLKEGPRWMPAHVHGHQPESGFAWVTVEF